MKRFSSSVEIVEIMCCRNWQTLFKTIVIIGKLTLKGNANAMLRERTM